MTKTRQWTVFTAVAVIVVLAAGWLLLVKPQRSHASDLRSQALTQQQANQVLLSQIARLQQEEKSLPAQQAALRKFTTQVPDNSAEPTLIRQLSAVANASNVELLSMTPGAATLLTASATATPGSTSLVATPTTMGQVYELPVALSVTGTYPNLESFFLSLEKLPRALLVGSWSICSGTGAGSGGSCQAPTSPTGLQLASNVLGGTLNANVFYSPPAGATATTPTTGTPGTTAATGTSTTTPSATSTTAATPAPSSTPAN